VKTLTDPFAGGARGFTLIELLIVMVIAGVLAVLAIPSYQRAVQRANRIDARIALLRVQYQQERHYAQFNRYASDLSEISQPSDAGNYGLALESLRDAQDYIVTAHAMRRQSGDQDCQWFSIDALGRRLSASATGIWTDANDHRDPARCWG
jgi:type IV pilus assembly protein PilE